VIIVFGKRGFFFFLFSFFFSLDVIVDFGRFEFFSFFVKLDWCRFCGIRFLDL
jgi:hypothetical protein